MRQFFHDVALCVQSGLRGSEQFQCWFSGESTDFVRFNKSVIRQPGHVRQISFPPSPTLLPVEP